MTRTIWKFKILGGDFGLVMPHGARILTVQQQGECSVIWALVDPDAPRIVRNFRLVVTGGYVEEAGSHYIGTFQAGWFVGHLFELVS
jgi:hypothetical protein